MNTCAEQRCRLLLRTSYYLVVTFPFSQPRRNGCSICARFTYDSLCGTQSTAAFAFVRGRALSHRAWKNGLPNLISVGSSPAHEKQQGGCTLMSTNTTDVDTHTFSHTRRAFRKHAPTLYLGTASAVACPSVGSFRHLLLLLPP